MRADSKNYIKKAAVLISAIVLWQLIFYLTTSVFRIWKPYMFPNPAGVYAVFVKMAGNGTLLLAIATSLRRVFSGYLISILIGALLGFLTYRYKLLGETLKPLFLGLQTLPSICWIPFAILWFGLNEKAILFVIVIGSAFSIAIAVETGLKNVNPLLVSAGKTMGADKIKLFAHIIIPDSMPHIIVGLKQGWSFAWRALMNGEMLSAAIGLGQILMLGRDLSDINQVMCVMLVIILLGVALDRLLFGIIESKMRRNRGIQPS